jgi:hypothetical protein
MHASVHHFSLARWTWMTFLGWLLGLVVAILGGDLMGDSAFVFTYFGAMVGLFVGLMQWLTIRKFAIGPSWIWITALGVGAGFFIVEAVLWILSKADVLKLTQDQTFYFTPLETMFGGLACGWLQSKYQLSRVSRAGGWVTTQVISWFAVTAVIVLWFYVTLIFFKGSRHPLLLFGNFVTIFGPGLLLGWLSGRKLKTMLNEHHWIDLPAL